MINLARPRFLFWTKALRLQPCAASAEEKFQRRVQLNSPWQDHIAALQGVLNTKVIVFPRKRLESRRKKFIIHRGPCSCLMLNVAREVLFLINDWPARAKKNDSFPYFFNVCFCQAHYFLRIFVFIYFFCCSVTGNCSSEPHTDCGVTCARIPRSTFSRTSSIKNGRMLISWSIEARSEQECGAY